jgi:hypothetical protein
MHMDVLVKCLSLRFYRKCTTYTRRRILLEVETLNRMEMYSVDLELLQEDKHAKTRRLIFSLLSLLKKIIRK